MEVAVAKEKSRGGWFPGEPNQAWEYHSTIKSQIQEHIQNAQQDEHPEVDILSQNPEEAPLIENGNDLATTGTKDEEEPKPKTLDHHDFPALCRTRVELEVRHKKKNLNLFSQA